MYFKMFASSKHESCKHRAVGWQPLLPTVYNSKQHFNPKNHTLVFALLILKDLQTTSLWLKFILKMWSIYLHMDIWSKKIDDRMRVLVTESSEIFFFFSFLPFLYLLSKNENRASYWKGNLFPFQASHLGFSGQRLNSRQNGVPTRF